MSMSTVKTPVAIHGKHQCDWNCGEPILKGEKYVTQSGTFDGEWYHSRWHSDCYAAANKSTQHEEAFCIENHARGELCDGH